MPDMTEKIDELRRRASRYVQKYDACEVGDMIGSGGSAAVFKIQGIFGVRALKVYDPTVLAPENRSAELHRLSLQQRLIGVECDGLASTYSIEVEEDSCFIEMEYVPWKQLKEVLPDVPDDCVESLILQLVNGVQELEKMGLVHRDVKPENILVSDDFRRLKLIDFGVIRDLTPYDDGGITDQGHRKPFLATAQYSSPEYLFRLIEPSSELWKGLSLYQVGAVSHDLLTKAPLFIDEVRSGNRFVLAMAVLRKNPELALTRGDGFSRLRRLAANCLAKDLKMRLALVDWSDFFPAEESRMEQLKRRLVHRRSVASLGGDHQAITDEQRLLRLRRLESLKEETCLRLLGELSGFVKFEWGGIENSEAFSFTPRVPDCEGNLKVVIRLEWGNDDQSQFANVFIGTSSSQVEKKVEQFVPAGVLDLMGKGQSIVVDAVCETVASEIAAQLESENFQD